MREARRSVKEERGWKDHLLISFGIRYGVWAARNDAIIESQ